MIGLENCVIITRYTRCFLSASRVNAEEWIWHWKATDMLPNSWKEQRKPSLIRLSRNHLEPFSTETWGWIVDVVMAKKETYWSAFHSQWSNHCVLFFTVAAIQNPKLLTLWSLCSSSEEPKEFVRVWEYFGANANSTFSRCEREETDTVLVACDYRKKEEDFVYYYFFLLTLFFSNTIFCNIILYL